MLYVDIGPVNVNEALKVPKWMNSMLEKLKSIKINKT